MSCTHIELLDLSGKPVARIEHPKRVLIRAPFGAMKARCFVELYQEDCQIPLEHAWECRIEIKGATRFRGRVVDVRRDTVGDELSFHAAREPEIEMTEGVSGIFENRTPSEILLALLSQLEMSPLLGSQIHPVVHRIDRLEFAHHDLFYALDLLAKLSGNYLWDIDWNLGLRFRPNQAPPDHVLHFDKKRFDLKIWKTAGRIKNFFELYGGVVQGNQFQRIFAHEESIQKYGIRKESLYVRAITTEIAFQALRSAVVEQCPHPVFEKHLDRFDQDLSIRFGDTLEIRHSGMMGLDEHQIYRVSMEEIIVEPTGQIRLRYHLADLWESSSRFLRYLDHDAGQPPGDYVIRRIGPFQLDHSSLDSQARLDG